MQLLTREAAEAVHWLTERMPNGIFDQFTGDMENALKSVLTRYGLDHELISAFSVEKLVGERAPIDGGNQYQSVEADIYGGGGDYAITGTGAVFVRTEFGYWRKSRLTRTDVIARSLTRIPGTINIKAKDA
ncbi:hypothetical protein EU642_22330 [Salmonella enterica]|nr:hypothetical protein [Salmonella enterica]EAO0118592.1 hypothetical protein [Salmonella enterica]EAO3601695.1 hypothetical protein [Salmonella enterica]EAR6391590.1 hypothetical protein [Salmonella enterica]EAV1285354.1 hypothetical protein [Salmonella enterica]